MTPVASMGEKRNRQNVRGSTKRSAIVSVLSGASNRCELFPFSFGIIEVCEIDRLRPDFVSGEQFHITDRRRFIQKRFRFRFERSGFSDRLKRFVRILSVLESHQNGFFVVCDYGRFPVPIGPQLSKFRRDTCHGCRPSFGNEYAISENGNRSIATM